ncbi:ImcF-related family protein [Pandoraea cepalis]|nr:ImcF-related family protein [Pandoraea cepalis]
MIFLALSITFWIRGSRFGWSTEVRIIVELLLLSAFLICILLVKYLELAIQQVASLRVTRWVLRYDTRARNTSSNDGTMNTLDVTIAKHGTLRQLLRDRHGWRWRYRDRWILITGNEQLVERLSPALTSVGFALTPEAVLLYIPSKVDAEDQDSLTKIRRLRRRPVDAVVALTGDAVTTAPLIPPHELAQTLSRIGRALRWAAPVYLLDVAPLDDVGREAHEAVGLMWTRERIHAGDVGASLSALSNTLADAGVARLSTHPTQRTAAALSQHIARIHDALTSLLSETAASQQWRHAVHGVLFAPLASEPTAPAAPASDTASVASRAPHPTLPHQTLWQTVARHSRKVHGRRVGLSLSSIAAWFATSATIVWIIGVNLSGFHNRATLSSAAEALAHWHRAPDRTQQMLALNGLGRHMDTLEVRERNGAPWSTRFGLNRDGAILDAMWPVYVGAAQTFLMTPVRHALEGRLMRLASLSDAEIADGGNMQADAAHNTLEAYLMLATPSRVNANFLTPHLINTAQPVRPNRSELSPGTWADLSAQTITFLASHLSTERGGLSLAMPADRALVASTRQTIISVRGIQNSTDALYEKIIDDAQAKYPPVSLTSLLGDTTSHGLFTTAQTLPGVYTRAAFEERIARAIDAAGAAQDVTGDWVLSDAQRAKSSPSDLKAKLRQRYFDDFARAWETFLNSLHWQSAPTLTGTVDQLLLLGDPQRSPMVALMNAIHYQASTGISSQSLAAGLLDKAQQLVGNDKDPATREPTTVVPLGGRFGPILRLTGSPLVSTANSAGAPPPASAADLSLARYLERVTAMRLKLQQMVSAPDPDAMSRVAAQAVLQGKTSEIADSRDYASRVAASLGGQWAGFGAVLQAPLDQAWQVVVQPAAASLNDIWHSAIVADWNTTLGSRYPFTDSDNDASLPEMARFMHPDGGVIAQFVATQLAGVIERQGDRWVPTQGQHHGGLALDSEFLSGLNRLTRVANVLFPSGDARVRFDLRGVPTPGITDVRIVLSDKDFHYFNQKEEWVPFEWPGQAIENVTRVEWQTAHGGLRAALDAQGRFGLIRLLERAQREPHDSARYLLTWAPDQATDTPLRVQMRSESGAGPLEVVELRHFVLPARIFAAGTVTPRVATPAKSPRAPRSEVE